MDPPLRQRLSWRTSIENSLDVATTRASMARVAAYFAAGGGTTALAAALLPHGPHVREWLLAAIGAAALLLAGVLIWLYDRLPLWGFHVVAALGTVLSTVALYAWGMDWSYGPLAYVWVALYAFAFFPPAGALAQAGFIGVAYAVELLLESPPYTPLAGWVATVVTLLVTGGVVTLLRARLMRLLAVLTNAVRRDPLTELLNRRGFEEAFDIELERARRSDARVSLIVGDVDGFKRVNDDLGHREGDAALRLIAREIGASKRSFDSAARVGGDEFAIIAPGCDEHGAYVLSERIRTAVERNFQDRPHRLTVSAGIATFPLHGGTAEALLRAGDHALYAAKRLGRNRTVISSAEVPGILARAPRSQQDGHVELAMLLDLAEALDVRDSGNAAHCQRVGRYAELIARELGLAPESVERVRLAGILHDVGRVGVPDAVLRKPGPLSSDEWPWVRSHPEVGARMLDATEFQDIGSWVLCHHERPDGTGYPAALAADQVPLEACILSVADAYEAMTSDRPYRPALDPDSAARELRTGAGRQFDERVVEALLRVV